MRKSPKQVLAELRGWDFGDPAAEPGFRFIEKLVAKTGWTTQHADTVMEEFRRFVVLWTYYGDDTLVPSPCVDDVWHLALQYTRRYQAMCEQYCGRFKHHNPNISQAQKQARREALAETLERYRDVFQEEPPAHIWAEQESVSSTIVPAAWADCA